MTQADYRKNAQYACAVEICRPSLIERLVKFIREVL